MHVAKITPAHQADNTRVTLVETITQSVREAFLSCVSAKLGHDGQCPRTSPVGGVYPYML